LDQTFLAFQLSFMPTRYQAYDCMATLLFLAEY